MVSLTCDFNVCFNFGFRFQLAFMIHRKKIVYLEDRLYLQHLIVILIFFTIQPAAGKLFELSSCRQTVALAGYLEQPLKQVVTS